MTKCDICSGKLYSVYIELSIENGFKRYWKIIGKICKNKHYVINPKLFDFYNFKYYMKIFNRTLYTKQYINKKQEWNTIGLIWFDYSIELYLSPNFFNYPITICCYKT